MGKIIKMLVFKVDIWPSLSPLLSALCYILVLTFDYCTLDCYCYRCLMRDHQNQRGMSNDDINLIQMLILPQLPSASLFNFPKKISPTDSFWEGFECECTLTGSVSQMQDRSICMYGIYYGKTRNVSPHQYLFLE